MLVGAGEIFLRKILQVDTFSKKGDPTEPKTLVIIMFGHTIHRFPPRDIWGNLILISPETCVRKNSFTTSFTTCF